MTEQGVGARELVGDELDLLRRLLPLDGARVVDLGCGGAQMSRRLVHSGLVKSVVALEVDQTQHAANIAAPPVPALSFLLAGADATPLPDQSHDLALMFKSLHHVPLGLFAQVDEIHFDTPLVFRDFQDFYERMVGVTHSDIKLAGERLEQVRRCFETHMTPAGARFVRPMRVNLLRQIKLNGL